MANSTIMTTGLAPRALQGILDRVIEDSGDAYKGPGDSIFSVINTKKGYVEAMKMAGMGLAAAKDEGAVITYDSRNQAWTYGLPVVTYEKSCRITMEAIADNIYEDQLSEAGKELVKSIDAARDTVEANIFNDAFTSGVTYGDGSVLCATNHALQAGGTNSNRAGTDSDLTEDALELAAIAIAAFKNDDGIVGDYSVQDLLIHPSNMFEAHRILKSIGRVNVPDNDTNALKDMGIVRKIVSWKRLSDSDSFFLTTNCDGLILARRQGITTRSSQDNSTLDTLLTAYERYGVGVFKHQAVYGVNGAA
jgi:hypothetical protein